MIVKRRIDFKSLSKLEQEIIYVYNARVYNTKIVNSTNFLDLQITCLDKILLKYNKKLSDEAVKRIKKYIEYHRRY